MSEQVFESFHHDVLTGHPATSPQDVLRDIARSAQQLFLAFTSLVTALFHVFYALSRLFLCIWYRFGPRIVSIIRLSTRELWRASLYGLRVYAQASSRARWLAALFVTVIFLSVLCTRHRVFARIAKKLRRAGRRTRRCIRHTLARVRLRCHQLRVFAGRLAVTLLPILLVYFPLYYLLTPSSFRRFFNAITFAVPVALSFAALLQSYSTGEKGVPLPTPSSLQNSNPKAHVSSAFPSARSRSTPLSIPSSNKASALSVHQRTATERSNAWLEYWIAASFFDILLQLPLCVLRVVLPSMFLDMDLGLYGYVAIQPRPRFFPPKMFRKTRWSYLFFNLPISHISTQSFLIAHDIMYTLLLVFVITHQQKLLAQARTLNLHLLDKILSYTLGIRVLNVFQVSEPTRMLWSSPESFSSTSSTQGLIPMLWNVLHAQLPSHLLSVFHLVSFVPQLLLLLFPPLLLPMCVFIVGVVYPSFSAVRSLTQHDTFAQNYWLFYFAMRLLFEHLLMHSLRSTFFWRWFPLTPHFELLLLTAIQLVCLRHDVVLCFIMGRLESVFGSEKTRNKTINTLLDESGGSRSSTPLSAEQLPRSAAFVTAAAAASAADRHDETKRNFKASSATPPVLTRAAARQVDSQLSTALSPQQLPRCTAKQQNAQDASNGSAHERKTTELACDATDSTPLPPCSQEDASRKPTDRAFQSELKLEPSKRQKRNTTAKERLWCTSPRRSVRAMVHRSNSNTSRGATRVRRRTSGGD